MTTHHVRALALAIAFACAACDSGKTEENGSGGNSGSGGAHVGSGGAGGGSGGAVGSGGAQGSGGKPGSGGILGSGGRWGSGGAPGSGGNSGSGGAQGSGGRLGSGGAPGSGGVPGSGGLNGTGGGTGNKSAGCGKASTRLDGKTQLTMQINGKTRYYLAYVPTTYDVNTPLPIVFVLHGMNMNNWWAAWDGSGFKLMEAANNKAIFVYPQGTGDAPGTTSKWGNIASNWSPGANGDDYKFLDALLSSIENTFCVDTSRRFFTGFSMGGWMTQNFACDRAKVFRAFAPVAGWGPGGMETGHGTKPYCSDTSVTVPILMTQGSADTTVTPQNGENARDFWVSRDGCSTTTTRPSNMTNCVAYQGCKNGLAVDYCTHSGGHSVPSEAGRNIWTFFSSLN